MRKPTLLGSSPPKNGNGNMGHNGTFSFDSRADIPPDVPSLYFFKFGIQDCLDDVLKMTSQERGVYLTALLVMYKEMEGLPADDKMAAMSLALDVREYRNIKAKLIARGVLVMKPSGRVSNKRFEAEISAYVIEFRNRQEAAKERERKKKEEAAPGQGSASSKPQLGGSYGTAKPQLGGNSPIAKPQLDADFSKKHNENNEHATTRQETKEHKPTRENGQLLVTSYESLEVQRSTINQSDIHGVHASEVSIDPKVSTAIGLLAVLLGSETDPDHDRAYAIAMKWAKAYSAHDVLDGVMDLDTRRRDRSEIRQVGEHIVGQYVRQAERNRLGLPSAPVVAVDKPSAQAIPVGPVAEGIEIAPGNRIVMSNGVRAEWLEKFGGDEKSFSLALTEIEGRLNRGATPLETQIRSGLAAIARGENLYAKTAKQNAAVKAGRSYAKSIDNSTGPVESTQERISRHMRGVINATKGDDR